MTEGPEFEDGFGWGREGAPTLCPRCERPLERFEWDTRALQRRDWSPPVRYEELVCYAGRRTAPYWRRVSRLMTPTGCHYAYAMGPFLL